MFLVGLKELAHKTSGYSTFYGSSSLRLFSISYMDSGLFWLSDLIIYVFFFSIFLLIEVLHFSTEFYTKFCYFFISFQPLSFCTPSTYVFSLFVFTEVSWKIVHFISFFFREPTSCIYWSFFSVFQGTNLSSRHFFCFSGYILSFYVNEQNVWFTNFNFSCLRLKMTKTVHFLPCNLSFLPYVLPGSALIQLFFPFVAP